MKRLLSLIPVVGFAAVALVSQTSCGGNDIKCGAGTTNQDGTCVPDSTCGTGTTLMNGQCVPDGSVVCAQGTVFNPGTGKCDLDPTACGPGTAFLNGHCVPEDDALTADLQEAAEPNDQTGAGMFNVPALNAATTIHGCITPRAGARDQDPWIVTATGPTLLEITSDGVHGLAGAFAVIDGSDNPLLARWQRLGINFTGDTSKRQVYLPTAGSYVLLMDDSRSLFTGEASGSTNTCYFGTIKNVALPAATALTLPQTTGQDSGNVRVLTFDATATGDVLDVTQNTDSASMVTGFDVIRNDTFIGVGVADNQNGIPAFFTAGGLNAGDHMQVIVDPEYDFGIAPQDYTLDNFHIGAQALSTNGTAVTVTEQNGDHTTAPEWDVNLLYFDVATAGQIVHFNLTSSVAANMLIVPANIFDPSRFFDSLATIDVQNGVTTFQNQFVRFPAAGRYYFVAFDPAGTSGTTYTLTSTLTNQTTTAATYGTPMAAQALGAQGSSFYSVDVQATNEWLEVGIPAAANWGAAANNARVTLYNLAGSGWLGHELPAIQSGTQPITGTNPLGRIVLNDNRDYLVRVEDTGTPGTGPTFTLAAQERAHTQLGAIAVGTPITRNGMDNVAAGGVARFLVLGTAGKHLRVQATPTVNTVDIKVDRVNVTEGSVSSSDIVTPGATENLPEAIFAPAPNNYFAVVVTNKSGATATNLNLTFTSSDPIGFTDICPTGTVLPAPFDGTADDDYSAVQTLPAGFNFYGAGVTQAIIGANGFLVFGNTNPTCSFGCYAHQNMPSTASPNNVVAPYWTDLDTVTVCTKADAVANTYTVQWSGHLYQQATTVQFQAILHQNGTVDFVYGPNQQVTGIAAGEDPADGSFTTVGVENATGTAAHLIGNNVAGTVAPGYSYTIATP